MDPEGNPTTLGAYIQDRGKAMRMATQANNTERGAA